MADTLTARVLARPSFHDAFDAPAFVGAMLAFEAALAEAQADEGVIPRAAADAIAAACASAKIDVHELLVDGKRNATLVVPFVRMLKAHVARASPGAEKHVHYGTTTQDVLDTAMALCLKACLEEADRALEGAVRALARRAREHRATPMLARTLMQPALPMTAGLKIARWAHALARDRDRLGEAMAEGLAVQFGGPIGALEAFGEKGPAIRHRIASRLGLADVPAWHVQRNAWIDLLDRAGQVVATAGKIARDVSLASQPEVGEMLEAPPDPGVGRSSAMPHKRNPAATAYALAAALRTPGLLATLHACALSEDERSLGAWQAELATVPDLAAALGTCLDFLEVIAASLVVDAARMKANLEAHGPAGVRGAESALAACDEMLGALAPYLS